MTKATKSFYNWEYNTLEIFNEMLGAASAGLIKSIFYFDIDSWQIHIITCSRTAVQEKIGRRLLLQLMKLHTDVSCPSLNKDCPIDLEHLHEYTVPRTCGPAARLDGWLKNSIRTMREEYDWSTVKCIVNSVCKGERRWERMGSHCFESIVRDKITHSHPNFYLKEFGIRSFKFDSLMIVITGFVLQRIIKEFQHRKLHCFVKCIWVLTSYKFF